MFQKVTEFEERIAEFFGAPYAVAVDSCTHGVELCLRYKQSKKMVVPTRTYLSIAFLAKKLGIPLEWSSEEWTDYYEIADKIYDAAVLWKRDSYIPGTMMSLSFQFQKHLNLGRGGMVLLDDKESHDALIHMSYDGRDRDTPWRDQNIKTYGYHYYMTPETALLGIERLEDAINRKPKQWVISDWPDISLMEVFRND